MLPVPALPRKLLTLAFILRERAAAAAPAAAAEATHPSSGRRSSMQVLMGEKKRGFGQGKWNGFGGKVEATDASIAAAAAREIQEEANVTVREQDLEPRGVLLFSFESGKEVLEVHVFLTYDFVGEPSESEEMKPQWYDADDIPFDQMWADDSLWLPHVLDGKSVSGHFHFAKDEDTLLEHTFEVSP
ncbi:hypothetical protein BBJ28_00014098 [Nothophytophthora sp. Chile5]|nr:hypothetical protein BBJ28_00014098 [Nothophytophthora sp. Chile5]